MFTVIVLVGLGIGLYRLKFKNANTLFPWWASWLGPMMMFVTGALLFGVGTYGQIAGSQARANIYGAAVVGTVEQATLENVKAESDEIGRELMIGLMLSFGSFVYAASVGRARSRTRRRTEGGKPSKSEQEENLLA